MPLTKKEKDALRERAAELVDGCESPRCESGCACQSANLGGAARYMKKAQVFDLLCGRALVKKGGG